MDFPLPKVNAFTIPRKKVDYDDIVRKDNYRPDSESKRDLIANGNIPTVNGLYDSNDGKKNPVKFDDVSPLEIGLREGRVSKEDLPRIKSSLEKIAKNESEAAELKDKVSKAEASQKARDKALDGILGINSDSSE